MPLKILTHIRKHLLPCLGIGAVIEVVDVALNWDGTIDPIAWLVGIVFTAVFVYIGIVILIGVSKILFPLFNRIFIR